MALGAFAIENQRVVRDIEVPLVSPTGTLSDAPGHTSESRVTLEHRIRAFALRRGERVEP
jgi:hypothetical protein